MKYNFPGGVWPVMLTPFDKEGNVDYPALEKLTEWYIAHKVSGLFAVCQSSEMFYLSLEERIKVAEIVVKAAAGRIPVIASGHISDEFEDQVQEINCMAKTGVQAVVLITNRLAKEEESDEIWIENCSRLLDRIDDYIPLGFYECPYPYKRVMSAETIAWCTNTERFYFLKDTCCDIEQIKEKIRVIQGTNLKLYNANTTTLLESLRSGAAGYSGVMANFHPLSYVWLCENFEKAEANELSDVLSIASLIERQYYPINAKYHLSEIEKLPMEIFSRVKSDVGLTETFKAEVHMLDRMICKEDKKYCN